MEAGAETMVAMAKCLARLRPQSAFCALDMVNAFGEVSRAEVLDEVIDALPETDTGRVLLANSITLTPGTVSVDVDGKRIKVHALTPEAARAVEAGDLNRRVAAVEGR